MTGEVLAVFTVVVSVLAVAVSVASMVLSMKAWKRTEAALAASLDTET